MVIISSFIRKQYKKSKSCLKSSLGFDVNDVCKSFALLYYFQNYQTPSHNNAVTCFCVCVFFYYNTGLNMLTFIVFTGKVNDQFII